MNIFPGASGRPDYPAIGGSRWWLAALALLMLILTLTPAALYVERL